MDSNNWRQPEQPPADGDWRLQLQNDYKQRVVNQIMNILKRHLPSSGEEGIQELREIAMRFEEKIYHAATSQSDYLTRISKKMLTIESKSRNPQEPASQTVQNQTQSHPIPIAPNQPPVQERPQILNQNIQITALHPNIQASNHPPVQGRPQILNQNIQIPALHPNIQNMSQNTMGNSMVQGLPSNNFANPQNQMQSRQQNMQPQNQQQYLYPQHRTSPSIQQPSQSAIHQQSVLRQNQQQTQISQQSMYQSQQQQQRMISQQNNLSSMSGPLQQQQIVMLSSQSGNHSIQTNHNAHMLQQQMMQSQTAQFRQQQQQNMQQRLQTSNQLLQQQQAPSSSLNSPESQEEVYQKIKAMKELYFQEISDIYQKICLKIQQLSQQAISDGVDKLKFLKQILGRILQCLQMSRSNAQHFHKDKLAGLEKQIDGVINSHRPKNPVSVPQSQITQAQSHERGVNSQLQSVSSLIGPNMMNSLQPSSNLESGQVNAPNSIQQNPLSSNMLQTQQTKQQQGQQLKQQLQHREQLLHKQQQQQIKQQHGEIQIQQKNDVKPNSSPPLVQTGSPQINQSQVDQQNNLSKVGTPQQNMSPLAPSKPNIIQEETNIVAPASASPLAIGTPGISTSPVLAESSPPDGQVTTLNTVSERSDQPHDRLLKVLKSMSAKALKSAVDDIVSVVSVVDRIPGSPPGNGSRAVVAENLVARLKRMRPLNIASSVSGVKRCRIEVNQAILDEIKDTNEHLMDTVVYLSDEDVDSGTIIKCRFNAASLSPNLKSHYQISPIQTLRLRLPTNYPNCSPTLLDKSPVEVSDDLSMKVKSRFSISLKTLSQPMSLKEIARTWDKCARCAFTEYAQQSDGGTFSSKYGSWKNCLSDSKL